MNDNLREIVLGVLAAGLTTSLGWFGRTYLWRRGLRRKQRFFGLPEHSECLLVVGRKAATGEGAVSRDDVFALLELSALIKDCGANAQVISHEAARQGFGERTEFCIGGPAANRRTAAHLHSLLPGVRVNTDPEPGPDQAAFTIGSERYRMAKGSVEYVLLARLTAGEGSHPVFVLCGQRAVTNQAAARHLARHHRELARRHGRNGDFCLLLKVINSQAYGPDVVELVSDVTQAATSPPPTPVPSPAPASGGRRQHRAQG
ncbi:hypothetical protein CUT44_31520 [Streptomyces carminius]|uniref:Secreted protein n=1 Tax=Streptomyces carminius TaxID=2665496 RepID=A0A2M8LP67_9ACTN|nr:hypothetical protein [Streptomyces carminius]PJE93747.1 hypothetical protein CUT44_31520 [Streptomyces carminius]